MWNRLTHTYASLPAIARLLLIFLMYFTVWFMIAMIGFWFNAADTYSIPTAIESGVFMGLLFSAINHWRLVKEVFRRKGDQKQSAS